MNTLLNLLKKKPARCRTIVLDRLADGTFRVNRIY